MAAQKGVCVGGARAGAMHPPPSPAHTQRHTRVQRPHLGPLGAAQPLHRLHKARVQRAAPPQPLRAADRQERRGGCGGLCLLLLLRVGGGRRRRRGREPRGQAQGLPRGSDLVAPCRRRRAAALLRWLAIARTRHLFAVSSRDVSLCASGRRMWESPSASGHARAPAPHGPGPHAPPAPVHRRRPRARSPPHARLSSEVEGPGP